MQIAIDISHRNACQRAHSATHLLHAALQKIFPHTKQEGSFVGPDILRFDFAADRFLTHDEIRMMQDEINQHINHNLPITTKEMSFADAQKLGAKAFFADKYGETVRVVCIGDNLSIELCGGTHAKTTGDIGGMVITGQESVSAGVRRIHASCGNGLVSHANTLTDEIQQIVSLLGLASSAQIFEKITTLQTSATTMEQQYEQTLTLLTKNILATQVPMSHEFPHIRIDLDKTNPRGSTPYKDIVASMRRAQIAHPCFLYDETGFFALLGTESLSAKLLQQKLGLKGGGNDACVQGKDFDGLKKIIER